MPPIPTQITPAAQASCTARKSGSINGTFGGDVGTPDRRGIHRLSVTDLVAVLGGGARQKVEALRTAAATSTSRHFTTNGDNAADPRPPCFDLTIVENSVTTDFFNGAISLPRSFDRPRSPLHRLITI